MTTCRTLATLLILLLSPAVSVAAGSASGADGQPPGAAASTKTNVLEAGAALLQDKPPIDAINAYLDGFHFYNGNLQGQVEAHHYCSILNEEVIQCVIFDGNGKDAKLMGVEYIVSERLFKGLPEREKALWHSHVHEVKSGQLVAPGIPQIAEKALMEKLIGTYGKTWHTWHTGHTGHGGQGDQANDLPTGVPQLMMGFTADGQVDPKLVAERDRKLKLNSDDRRKDRADIASPPIAEGADAWQHGRTIQLTDPTGGDPADSKGQGTRGQGSAGGSHRPSLPAK